MNTFFMKENAFVKFLEQPHRLLIITMIMATVLTFWKLGSHPVADWDESRQGVNAMEMIERGDYINLYYHGELDTWSVKPPLLVWAITVSYKAFGYNAFAMRFPAALGTLLFFFLAWRLVRLYRGRWFAFAVIWILFSCRAVLGEHVGRTADCDAYLLPFLTGFAYCFALFHDFEKRKALLMAGVFLGLAFYAKGPVSVFLLPGAFLYVLLSGTFVRTIKSRYTWGALVLFVLIGGSWVYISANYGARFQGNLYGGDHALKTMFIYDTFERFTSTDFAGYHRDPFYFFSAIDIRMNVWNYLFYASLLLGGVLTFKKGKQLLSFIRKDENRLLLLSFCMVFSLAVLLSISKSSMGWYLAPVFLFIAVITVSGMAWVVNRFGWMRFVFAGLFLFLFGRHFMLLNQPDPTMRAWLETHQEELATADVYMYKTIKPALLLNLKWQGVDVKHTHYLERIPPDALIFSEWEFIKGKDSISAFGELRMQR